MSAYFERTASALLQEFGNTANDKRLGQVLTTKFKTRGAKKPQPGEINSWNQSLPALANALEEAGLGNLAMFIEFTMPPSNRCADVVLAGPSKESGKPAYMVVELKQWTDFPVQQGDGMVDISHKSGDPNWKMHPWKQTRNYMEYLADAYGVLGSGPLYGAAYLHNATSAFIERLRQVRDGAGSYMFGADERAEFTTYLHRIFGTGSSADAARLLRTSRPRVSDGLLSRINAEFRAGAKDRFVLLEEQKLAYEMVFDALHEAALTSQKAAVIVRGKPGTGKTAVALKLAGEYFLKQRGVYYQVWHTAFRNGLIAHSGLKKNVAERIFVSPRGKYVRLRQAPENIALSICDEAHRLEEWTRERTVQGIGPQIEDILAVTNLHVFFIDDDQQVKMKEIGTVERLRKELEGRNVLVSEIELTTQFRSGGVDAYVDWTRRLVGLEDSPPGRWEQREDFELWIAERPEEVEQILKERAGDQERYRITAGFCWKWSDKKDKDGIKWDFLKIGDWTRKWNLKTGSDEGPKSSEWAWQKGGFEQIGCIHTSQGLEWEWTGVIIGTDLVWDGEGTVPVLEKNLDLPNYADDPERQKEAMKLIRNAYYVLMTRGQRGAVIYAEDSRLRAALRALVDPMPVPLPLTVKEQQDLPGGVDRLDPEIKTAVDAFHRAGGPLARAQVKYVPTHRAQLAWREKRVAILSDTLSSDDADDAKRAYADAGWTARRESDWDAGSLLAALGVVDASAEDHELSQHKGLQA
ncbi:DNA/RNA helicase domain-containing protein [Glycomyces sp. NPDC049804]|uniref:DNA/RNA helicase domain-containing protein n=1 Tax=Glycomyces sp. NPDC049804 TaxID=3154363 RepID=UPI00343866FB